MTTYSSVVNMYAPNEDSPEFFVDIIDRQEFGVGDTIMAGDFNLVLNNDLVRKSSAKNNTKSRCILKQFMSDFVMVDVWRHHNPEAFRFNMASYEPTPSFLSTRLFLSELCINVIRRQSRNIYYQVSVQTIQSSV